MKANTTAILYLLLYISSLSIVLPILFFLLFKRKSKIRAEWVIFIYLSYALFNEGLTFYLQKINSDFVLNAFAIYTILELVLIGSFFFILFKEKKNIRKLILFCISGFLLFAIPNFFIKRYMENWDSKAIGIESLIIMVLSGYYLFTQIRRSSSFVIYSTFNFWIVITFLLYFSGTFFLNIMAEAMRKNPEYQLLYFYINPFFNILKNILLTVAVTRRTISINKNSFQQPPFETDLIYR